MVQTAGDVRPGLMLAVDRVTKQYGNKVLALDGVDLTVRQGEIVCLLGPSGCGKTTLLRVIAGLDQQDSGQVRLDDQDLSAVPVHRRRFGYMFQDFALFPHKTVADNVAFGLRMENLPKAQIDERVDEMLSLVSLEGYQGRSVFELSGGERQRIALARSLAPQPRLLMLDEPLGSLDRTLRESLMGELRTILKQVDVTAIYVTHDQEEAFAIGDRIAIMLAGRIAQIGSPETVYKRPGSADIARFLGFTSLLPASLHPADPRLVRTPIGDIPQYLLADKVSAAGDMLLIRPDSARIASPALGKEVEFPYLTVGDDGQTPRLRLTGLLTNCSFRGSQYRVTVRVPAEGGDIRLDFDLPAYQSNLKSGRLEPLRIPLIGRPIWLTVYPDLTTVLSSAATTADPAIAPV